MGRAAPLYRAVGGEREHVNEFNRGTAATYTFTSTFNVISQGGGTTSQPSSWTT